MLILKQLELHATSLEEHIAAKTAELHQVKERINQLKQAEENKRSWNNEKGSAKNANDAPQKVVINFARGWWWRMQTVMALRKNGIVVHTPSGYKLKAQSNKLCNQHGGEKILQVSRDGGGCTRTMQIGGMCHKHATKCSVDGCENTVLLVGTTTTTTMNGSNNNKRCTKYGGIKPTKYCLEEGCFVTCLPYQEGILYKTWSQYHKVQYNHRKIL